MNSPSRATLLFAIALLLAGLGSTAYLLARPLLTAPNPAKPEGGAAITPNQASRGSTKTSEPKVTWSQGQVEVTLSPGENTSKDLTFTSSQDLKNVTIEAVPEISGFLSIQPSSLTSVQKNQQQTVRISFSIPTGASLGAFDGTIRIRTNSQTLPQTLKIVVKIWPNLSRNGVEIRFPPQLIPLDTGTQVRFVDPKTPSLPPLFGISVYSTGIAVSGTTEEALRQVAEERLGSPNILSFGPVFDGGLFVEANTLFHKHFYWFDAQTGRVVEVVEGQNGFFSSSDFTTLVGSLRAAP